MPHENIIHHSREQTPTQPVLVPNSSPSPRPSSSSHNKSSVTPPVPNATDPSASLQSLLSASAKDTSPNGQLSPWNSSLPLPPQQHENGVQLVSQSPSAKRKHEDPPESDETQNKIRRVVRDHVSHDPARVMPMTTVVCLHAAVAQKSYGSEKRFLCPPPVVHIEGPMWQMRNQQLSMTVVGENGERANEQKAPLDGNMTASFKFLHVTGTAKAKNFQLSLDIADPAPDGPDGSPGRVWASFDSALVTIISKPSKKSAKTRNISSCILAGGPVSLFNRINSQTVRTKYMTIDHAQFCASNVSWSAFNVNVVRRPNDAQTVAGPQPVTYGSEIVLSDTTSGISTAPLVIRKVDKGRVSADDGGPVSQMQKIALQRINPDGSRHYLSAQGPSSTPGVVAPPAPGMSTQAGTHPLLFQSPRVRDELKDGVRIISDEVDDYLCWTIVGISKFQYTFFDASGQNNTIPEVPITPFPTLFTTPVYRQANNVIELTVSNFFYEDPKTRTQAPLDVYLGNLGPLRHRVYQASPPFVQPAMNLESISNPPDLSPGPMLPPGAPRYGGIPGPVHTIVIVEMPPIAEVIKALEEDALPANEAPASNEGPDNRNGIAANIAGRSLPLLFIRASDGVGYHSGRTITCESIFAPLELGATPDPNWIAAQVDSAPAIQSWSLRVM